MQKYGEHSRETELNFIVRNAIGENRHAIETTHTIIIEQERARAG
jgi:hypothetical protein